jgi:hypothetical protein
VSDLQANRGHDQGVVPNHLARGGDRGHDLVGRQVVELGAAGTGNEHTNARFVQAAVQRAHRLQIEISGGVVGRHGDDLHRAKLLRTNGAMHAKLQKCVPRLLH